MNEPEKHEHVEPEQQWSEDAGRKGGAASMAAAMPIARAGAISLAGGNVQWGPVWVGLLVALPVQLVLSGIGIALMLRSYNPAAADFGQRMSNTLGMWSAISMLIALFVGSYIASRLASAAGGAKNGWLQGSLVWALAMVLGVLLSAMGASGFNGAFSGIQALVSRGVTLTGAEGQTLIRMAGNATWWFVVGAVLSWITAVTGGLLGTYRQSESPST
jgi:hypothetical protein